jgi:hypothetical protein
MLYACVNVQNIEWRKAQKQWNLVWREGLEKNYLKSLDCRVCCNHCVIDPLERFLYMPPTTSTFISRSNASALATVNVVSQGPKFKKDDVSYYRPKAMKETFEKLADDLRAVSFFFLELDDYSHYSKLFL